MVTGAPPFPIRKLYGLLILTWKASDVKPFRDALTVISPGG